MYIEQAFIFSFFLWMIKNVSITTKISSIFCLHSYQCSFLMNFLFWILWYFNYICSVRCRSHFDSTKTKKKYWTYGESVLVLAFFWNVHSLESILVQKELTNSYRVQILSILTTFFSYLVHRPFLNITSFSNYRKS